jgi:hypothetical protein
LIPVLHALALVLALAPSARGRTRARVDGGPKSTSLRGEVDLEGAHGLALLPPEPGPPAGPHAAARKVSIARAEGGVRITATWTLAATKPGWYAATLLGPGAHVERISIGGARATGAGGDAGTLAIARVDGRSTIELVAFVPGDPARGPVPISLAPAVKGTIELVGLSGVRLEEDGGLPVPRRGAIHFGAPEAIVLAPAPAKPKDDGAPVVVGQVGLGVTVGDAEIRTHARLRWELRRGQLAQVAVRVTGAGDDLEVTGPRVRKHERTGDRIVVELDAAESRRVDVELRWSKATPKGEAVVDLPEIRLEDVARSELTVEIARDGDIDVLPELAGWTATAPQAMPAWGRDLIEGSATAAFRAKGDAAPGKLALLRFVPVAGPPAVIQRALVRIAATAEGRALVQVRWELANERKAQLRMGLPKGATLLSIEAAGRDVRPARDGDTWLVPVPRSLETVEGLVDVPVVATMLLARAPWDARERREIELPTVDVPIGEVTVELQLPRGYKSRMKVGDYGVRSNRRIETRPKIERKRAYGPGKGKHKVADGTNAPPPVADPSAADVTATGGKDELERAAADRILREATDAYQQNDFDKAQGKLDELRTRGLEDDDAERIQSNLDILNAEEPEDSVDPAKPAPVSETSVTFGAAGSSEGRRKAAVVRRVREQAKARSGKKVAEQRDRRDKAKRLRSEGKYEEAKQEYREALKVTKELKKLEQDESTAYDFDEDALEGELEEVETESKNAASMQKLVDPSWLSIGEPAEHGFAALALGREAVAMPPPSEIIEVPPLDDGPRVLMPSTTGGDTIVYGFELWAEGTRHALVVRARRRLELPPR